MKNSSVLAQVFLLFIGFSIVGFYAYPEFTNISKIQDQIQEYNEAITEADLVNELLVNVVRTIENISPSDRLALETYLPQSIDPVAIQRDLQRYTDLTNLELVLMDYDEVVESPEGWHKQVFELTASGSYADVKRLMSGLEANDYPLRLVRFDMRPIDVQVIQVVLEVETYAQSLVSNL